MLLELTIMASKQTAVSIIIVYYHAKETLFACLNSLKTTKNPPHEVIVVDNDEKKVIDKEIKKKYPWITYVKSPKNVGFGGGNNLGAKYAKGEYLFFLNPDTLIFPDTIDELSKFLDKNKKCSVVAPLLLDPQENPYPIQGSSILTPLRAIFSLSFLNKLFPHNAIAKEYWQTGWDKTKIKELEVVPGTAFMIRKEVYDEVEGFDEHFFLYFEEYDLCKRIKEKGYLLYINPKAKIIHLWGKGGTNEAKNINKIFKQSRYYYFKKHYGLITALLVDAILSFGKTSLAMSGILLSATVLLFYRLFEFMPFFGDQGWFYLAARDVVLGKSLPLVSIPASHPWLHQGPYWTYMLAFMLWLFHFNPISGSYLTASIGIMSIYLLYVVGKTYFSKNVGIIASFLYAASPLVIITSRTAYHTSPIPFFTLLFLLSLYKWIQGNKYFFPLSVFFLAVLYNFELATATLGIIFVLITLFGIEKKTSWVKKLYDKRIIFLSVLAYLLPMLPMIIYDFHHGFPQTLKFVAWIGYHVLLIFGFPSIHPNLKPMSWSTVILFAFQQYQMFIFAASGIVALSLLIFSFGLFYFRFYQMIRSKKYHPGLLLVGVMMLLLLAGFFATRTTSDAYLPDIFPLLALLTAVAGEMCLTKYFVPSIAVIVCIVFLNIFTLLQHNYFVGITYKERLLAAKEIIQKADHRQYNLVGEGPGSKFASFTMNYQYLTWFLGHPVSSSLQKLQFVISETPFGIIVAKQVVHMK